MKITWYGHSCFMLESSHGSILFDPFENDYVPGYKNLPEDITADQVICSHEHGDHSARHLVNLSGKEHTYEIETIPTFHDEKEGSLRGKNNITIVKFDDLKVVHFGDLGCDLTDEQKVLLMNSDVVMIPVGGYYTIDARTAYKIIKDINAKMTIPMHYKGENFGFDVIADVRDFLMLADNAKLLSSNVLEIRKEDLSLPSTVVFSKP